MKQNCVHYQEPLGLEFQVERTAENAVSLHSDIFVIARLNDLVKQKNLQDLIVSRFQEIKSDLNPQLQDALKKLDDKDRANMCDSRYTQTLSDRSNRLKEFMKQVDRDKEIKADKEKAAKYERLRDELIKQQYQLFGIEDDDKS